MFKHSTPKYLPRRRGLTMRALALGALLLVVLPGIARAQECASCLCEAQWEAALSGVIDSFPAPDIAAIYADMLTHEEVFMDTDYFPNYILKGLQDMTEQLTTSGMAQMAAIGTFLDAQQESAVQRLLQQKMAQAHKDYQPDMDMCTIGTVARGLAAAQANGALSASILGDRLRDREVHAGGTLTSDPDSDVTSRVGLLLKRYCNPDSESGALAGACTTAAPAATVDRDVSVHRTLWQPAALNIDFSDATATDDETDILALQDNLYATQPLPAVPFDAMKSPTNQTIVLDERAIMAKRSVAENSFAALVGMKTQDASTTNDGTYVQQIYKQLGVSDTADPALATGNPPSYDSLMDAMTKRIYQDPRFYSNLYDTPANLARKGAALRAIDLMQRWDTFNSSLRREMLLAELVELDVEKAQDDVENRLNSNAGESVKVKQ